MRGRDDGRVSSISRPTVVLADAHERYRSGLARAIAMHPGLSLGAVTDDGPTALSLIVCERPELALLDVRLPGLDGFAVCERLFDGERVPPTRVVLLAAVLDAGQWARACGVGVTGVLSKDASRWEICEALVVAAKGEPTSRESRSGVASMSLLVTDPPAGRHDLGPNGRAA